MKKLLLIFLVAAQSLFAGARFGPNQAFRPQQISGLVFWVSSSSLVGANGSLIPLWQDQSTAGNHLVQGASSNQPRLTNNIVNGRPIVQFITDLTYITNTWAAFSGYATINSFMAVKINAAAAADTATLPQVWFIGNTAVPPFWEHASASGSISGEYICPATFTTALSALVGRAGSSTYRATAGSLALITEYPLDLVSGITTNSASGPLASGASGPVFFNATVGAAGAILPSSANNSILDFMTFNVILTTNDRQRVEQFFARRYGPTLLQ